MSNPSEQSRPPGPEPNLAVGEGTVRPLQHNNNTQLSEHSSTHTNIVSIAPCEYSKFLQNRWPAITEHAKERAPLHAELYDSVLKHGVPNYIGARIRIPSGLNIVAWREALVGREDERIVEYLEFGWPINYSATFLPHATSKNHQSALDYPEHVQDFLDKECSLGAMLGPFARPPLLSGSKPAHS